MDDVLVYETEHNQVFIPRKSFAVGHLSIRPKIAAASLSLLDDATVSDAFILANGLSKLLFERLQLSGTNLLIREGTAAAQDGDISIDIIPRTQGDALGLEWQPKQVDEQVMNQVHTSITNFEQQKIERSVEEFKEEEINEEESDVFDRLRRRLTRVP